jgi:DNA modification methylase
MNTETTSPPSGLASPSCSGSSVRPYYVDELVTIYLGDAREILPDLTIEPTILLTDPPYSSGGFQESGKSAGSIGTRGKEVIALDNLSTRGYQRLMREILRNCRTIDEAYICTDWRMWVHTSDALEDGGWRVRNMLVWDKQQMGMGLPWRNQHELIACAKRTSATMMDGKRGNVLNVKRCGNKLHPTEKPLELCQMILGNSQPGMVLDPFAGSGTTLFAAKVMGRAAVGIEMDERHAETAANRCSQGVLSFDCQKH